MKNKITTGIIPAAGRGLRMGELSKGLPKCLLPLKGEPIIRHVVDNMINVGIEKIFIPTFTKKDYIINYFKKNSNSIDADIEIIPLEKLPNGLALSIYSLKDLVDNCFLTILSDDVTINSSLYPLVDLFFLKKAIAVEGVVLEENIQNLKRTCCLKLGPNKEIDNIIEKPMNPFSKIRGCGIYVFDHKIFDYIEKTPKSKKRGEVELTDTISIVARDRKAYAEFISGYNLNVNTPADLLKARNLILESGVD